MVRLRLKVEQVKRLDGGAAEIAMVAQYDDRIPEDMRLADLTPLTRVEMYLTGPGTINSLPQGKAFYVDFTPVED